MTTHRTRVIPAAFALLFGLTACGPSATDAANETTPPTATTGTIVEATPVTTTSSVATSTTSTTTSSTTTTTTTTTTTIAAPLTIAGFFGQFGLRFASPDLPGSGFDETVATVSAVLGAPTRSGTSPADDEGPASGYAEFGGLCLGFSDSSPGGDGTIGLNAGLLQATGCGYEGDPIYDSAFLALTFSSGLGLGNVLTDYQAAYPAAPLFDSGYVSVLMLTDENTPFAVVFDNDHLDGPPIEIGTGSEGTVANWAQGG